MMLFHQENLVRLFILFWILWKTRNVGAEETKKEEEILKSLEDFSKWALDNGILFEKVELKHTKDFGNGVFAKEDINVIFSN